MAADLPRNMTILHPKEAIPILLDINRSPVVALDTEFDASKPVCQADLKGFSLASGNAKDGYIGTFFPYDSGQSEYPWTYVRDKLVWPLFADPDRYMVMHPPKVDMQPFRARGLTEVNANIECTFSMAHLFDENLPKGLKHLGEALLGVQGLLSHTQTVAEMRKIRKKGRDLASAIIKQAWVVYRDERKRSKVEEVTLDPAWPSWHRIAMALPPRLKKAEVVARLGARIRNVVEKQAAHNASLAYARYGALDALLTIGIRDFMLDGVPGVIPGLRDMAQCEHLPLEMEVCHPVVTEMEEHGCHVRVDLLRDIHTACAKAIVELEDELRKRWAPVLNRDDDPEWKPGSFDQIGEIVWNRWGHRPPPWVQARGEIKPSFRIKKTGLCSTKDEVLTFLVEKGGPHAEDLKLLLNWRGFTKIFGTYVEPMLLMALADPEHRLHASFWPVGARTGRFSSSDPNLENIPRPFTMPTIRIPAGCDPTNPPPGVQLEGKGDKAIWRVRSLRDIFIAPPGRKLVSADLAQVENRLIAHESQDPTLLMLFQGWDCADCGKSGTTKKAMHTCPECGAPEGKRDKTQPSQPAVSGFCLGRDIHAMTAHRLGLVERHGFDEGRQRAKADNHAYNYGMGANTLARREGMTVKEAQSHLDGLDRTYPYVRQRLHKRVKLGVKESGIVTIFDGHVRRFLAARLLMATDNFKAWEWEGVIREAVNVLAQGGTGVIMKRAMCAIRRRILREVRLRGRVFLINQIHDELLYECDEEIADYMLEVVIEELETAAPEMSVPILADGGVGDAWGEIH